MSDIVAFIEARLAEDEAAARAATAGPWLIDEGDEVPQHSLTVKGGPDQIPDVPGRETVVYSPTIWDETRPDYEHIVRWDPARVLAEVTAKRRVLARHAQCGQPEPGDGYCDAIGYATARAVGACPELLDVAAPYADHPDFDPAWRIYG